MNISALLNSHFTFDTLCCFLNAQDVASFSQVSRQSYEVTHNIPGTWQRLFKQYFPHNVLSPVEKNNWRALFFNQNVLVRPAAQVIRPIACTTVSGKQIDYSMLGRHVQMNDIRLLVKIDTHCYYMNVLMDQPVMLKGPVKMRRKRGISKVWKLVYLSLTGTSLTLFKHADELKKHAEYPLDRIEVCAVHCLL